jgi:hypothetical protein
MSTQIMHPAELEARLQARVDELRRSAAREEAPRRRWGLRPVSVAAAGLVATAAFAAVAAAVVDDSANCSVEVANTSGYAICTTTQNATVEFIGDANETFGSSGSGVFNSFVRVQANGTEDGYNTNGDLEFDTKAGNFTHAILVSAIPVVFLDPDGAGPAPFGAYWELFADLNEGNSAAAKLLSLNDVEVYFTTDPELTGYDFGIDPVYDFSGSIKINDVNQGSGRGDLRYRIPLADIDIPDGCNYGEPSCLTYFVLYNQWGTTTNYGSDATFEEFKVKQYPTLQIVKTAIGGDDTFTYTVTGPSTPLVPAPSITTVSGAGATPTYIVNPGTYTIDEDGPPAGWTLTGAVCSVNGGTPAAYTEGSNLVLGETTHVVCTFTNTKDGRIEIEKQTLPDGDPATFDFTGDIVATLADEGVAGEDVAPGSYSSTEDVPAGWTLTDITCDDSDSSGDIATGVASFVVDPGETVRCVFTNTKDGRIEIEKTVSGAPPNGETFDFELRTGASPTEVGTTVASTTTDPVTGEADFGGQTFDPGVYQFCEVNMLPGWHSTLSDDPNAFVPNSDDPNVDNSVVCVEFTLDPGETVTFTIDNTPPPGGDARTIGFWKNWTSCDGHGNQEAVLDDTLASFAGGGILVGDIFVDTCEEAVAILNKSSLDGTKRAGDAAYALAAQLLAAELNYQAGAIQCPDATDAIADGQALLDLINFNATGSYLGPKVKGAAAIQRQEALALAATLDDYNNNLLC